MQTKSKLYDSSSGKTVLLSKKIGAGGEGDVFALEGRADCVAKIYHKAVHDEKDQKLKRMVHQQTDELLKIAAWPVATLQASHNGKTVGILMPFVSNHSKVFSFYSPAQRKKEHPKIDWSFLVHAASNCCAAFQTVHSYGTVIGDVNQGNVLVNGDALIKLIDCDSFQITSSGKIFLNEVGVAEYTPPELQGLSFKSTQRTSNHDNFGLAILIYQLLCMGRHPFAGRYLGSGEMPLERAIKEHRFVYGRDSQVRNLMAPPPSALDPGFLPGNILTLFENSFGPQGANLQRPTAKAWHSALNDLKQNIARCSKVDTHRYPRHLASCPWCTYEKEGYLLFLHAASASSSGKLVINAALIGEIESLLNLGSVVLPAVQTSNVVPVFEPADVNLLSSKRLYRTVVACFAISVLSALGFSPVMYLAVLVFFIWWQILSRGGSLYVKKRSELKLELKQLQDLRNDAQQKLQSLHVAASGQLDQARQLLSGKLSRYRGLNNDLSRELRSLEDNKEKLQFRKHMESFLIEDANIAGIARGRKELLRSWNIETAFDIDADQILRIPNFGPNYTKRLVEWKTQKSRSFRFDSKAAVSQSEIQSINAKYIKIGQSLECDLRAGKVAFLAIQPKLTQQAELLVKEVADSEEKYIETEAKLRTL